MADHHDGENRGAEGDGSASSAAPGGGGNSGGGLDLTSSSPMRNPTAAPDFMSSWLGDSIAIGESSLSNMDFNQSIGSSFGALSVTSNTFNYSLPALSGSVPSRHRRTNSSEAGSIPRRPSPTSSRAVSLGASAVVMGLPGGPGVESALHDAARVTDWTEAHRLALAHPRMARFAGPDGWTALHHALSRRGCPPKVVAALIEAHPGALVHPNESKWTPLHFAGRFKAPREVVRLLLEANPIGRQAASMRCSKGRTPLYYAVRYDAPDGVEELLLDAHPGAVLDEDRDGVSPLALVWDKYATRLEGKQALHPYLQQTPGKEGNWVVLKGKIKARWERADRLLRAAFRFPYQNGKDAETGGGESENGGAPAQSHERVRKWRILHATAAIKCHSSLFELASVLHPEQASEVDEGDLYGEHGIDAESRLGHSRSTTCNDDGAAGAEGAATATAGANSSGGGIFLASHRTALHFAALSPARGRAGRTVLTTLLRLHPSAASAPDGVDGSLPLHLLAENGRKGHWVHDGVAELHAAHPDAVSAVDWEGRTPLHRACLAAAQRGSGTGHPVPTVAAPAAPTAVAVQGPALQGAVQQQQGGQVQDANPAPPAPAAAAPPPPPLDEEAAETQRAGSIVQNLLRLHPAAASAADSAGHLPLHVLADRGRGWDADAEAILSAHPSAVRVRAGNNAHSRLPIHLACANVDAGPMLLRRLVDAHPRGLSQADRKGKLPLHLSCEVGREWDGAAGGTRFVCEAYPPAVRQAESNPRGWTALHMAAASEGRRCPLLLSRLVELNPEAAGVQDSRGRYALHLACATGKAWEGGTENLFLAWPDAAIAEDARGWFPFHVAAVNLGYQPAVGSDADSAGDGGRGIKSELGSSLAMRQLSVLSNDSAARELSELSTGGRDDWDDDDSRLKIDLVYQLMRAAPIVLMM